MWYLNAKIIIIQKSHVSCLKLCFLLFFWSDVFYLYSLSQCRKSTGVTNNITDVPVPFKCTCGYVSEASMHSAVAPTLAPQMECSHR